MEQRSRDPSSRSVPADFQWKGVREAVWNRALLRAPGCSLQQDWAYGAAVEMLGHRCRRCIVRFEGRPVALAQFTERRLPLGIRIFQLVHGPAWIEPSLERPLLPLLIAEWRKRLSRGVLLWTPERPPDEEAMVGCRPVMTPQFTVVVDLRKEMPELEASLHGKWRNALRQARRSGVRVRSCRGGPRFRWLMETREADRLRKGYRGPSPAFFEALRRASQASGSQLVLVAEEAGLPVAGVMMQCHGRAATYLLGVTTDAGRRTRAHHLLLWSAMRRLRDRGVRCLDLGGVDTVGAPGVARFKLRMGGRVEPYGATYLLPLSWNLRRREEAECEGRPAQAERAA